MTFRPYGDNVVIVLEPLETETASGIALVQGGARARDHRTARVIASGPGYTARIGKQEHGTNAWSWRDIFIPNEVKPGDRVIVDALAGQDYAMDLTVPRHNKPQEFGELFGDRGQFRIVREGEILGVVEEVGPPP